MSTTKKFKITKTPKGKIVGFISIEKPSTKFDPNGEYSCKVAFTGEDAKTMKKTIDDIMEESRNGTNNSTRLAAPPYTVENKQLVVKFKEKARINKFGTMIDTEISLYDSKKNKINDFIGLGKESVVSIAYKPYVWNNPSLGSGCTLQLKMVQIFELVKMDMESNEDFNPFDADEGSFQIENDDSGLEEEELNDDTDDSYEGDF